MTSFEQVKIRLFGSGWFANTKRSCSQRVGKGRWNHNEADAYLAGVLGARFWKFLDGDLPAGELTPTETKYFTEIHVPKVGKTIKKGLIYRENERFFAWSH